MNRSRLYLICGLIFSAALIRVIPHPWNFTPIGAMALFSGANLGRKIVAVLVPLTAMGLSDIILGDHPTFLFVYLAIVGTVFLGRLTKNNQKWLNIYGMGILGSLLFFAVTNAGVWITTTLYPKTFAGFMQCLAAGIPFYRPMLIGDAFFITLIFGAFKLAEKKFTVFQTSEPLRVK